MNDPLRRVLPSAESEMASVRVLLFEGPDSVARVAHAIAAAGGRVHTLSTVRSLPDVEVMELELCVDHLNAHAVTRALGSIAVVLQVAAPGGAPMLDRRQTRIGGRVRWPVGWVTRGRQG